ncbi:hypothetical protein T03_8915 [Trichinella britovi]|uniref:Uncharacterized protein n=1 Tax=Trichinella britovi TaxID=45882 RepID=A0A0V1CDP1_TRIBR|nr:hypothetical protein T03_8915 [Trichinella britovi]
MFARSQWLRIRVNDNAKYVLTNSRCDLARGWCPEVAGRPRIIPTHRRPDRYLGICRHLVGVREAPCCALIDRRSRDNGELRHLRRQRSDQKAWKSRDLKHDDITGCRQGFRSVPEMVSAPGE